MTAFRHKAGLTRSGLADKAQTSRPYITQLESGDRKSPSLDVLDRFAEVLNVDDRRAFYVEPTVDELLQELAVAREREAGEAVAS